MPIQINRKHSLDRLKKTQFDCIFIGGGATGTGAALDATLRGLNTALLEKRDFSAGTSSKSTKLIHGGVRYLAQFHFKLIREALLERKRLLANAPHLVKPLKFVLPCYKLLERPYYGIGLTFYDILAGDNGLPTHRSISKTETIREFPSINPIGLTGAITYYDAQFNDARLNVLLAQSAAVEGACVTSRTEAVSFIKENGKITGVNVRDILSGEEFAVKTKVVINTTGVHIDEIRKMDDPSAKNVLSPSQGIHLVFKRDKILCKSAMIIPKTSDGRVVFVIPWEDCTIVGTTDTPVKTIQDEPMPLNEEVDFVLKTVQEYLGVRVEKKDVISIFAGLRPLIAPDGSQNTKNISREEMILISPSGLITMSGGKWSTYRKMAEDLVDKVVLEGKLTPDTKCNTYDYAFPGKKGYSENLYIDIAQIYSVSQDQAKRLRNYYGGLTSEILGKTPKEILPGTGLFEEEVRYFAESEFALGISDVIARRWRTAFTNLELAKKLVTPVGKILSNSLGWTQAFLKSEEKSALDWMESLEKSIGK
ncbi:MAG TPA: FAD-dependent oxidoreductase [Leptospiraceae bacterium]|nr:FAD-dependent oxidoreductase [Leptospiraceae bacterium]HNF15174.1 FAD-dependent oxidoreductase [Leptospiraceae bacterium]HNF25953.1 FAD-dependent oxidoreductase [Leptospiraceae bacterium]HNM01944.1 FAD-dependent oxidoreductase [Leptospiraceae bacterium]HNN03704.1 FAD-dependent oxidoreductase [Leptospiraceae bacterium]